MGATCAATRSTKRHVGLNATSLQGHDALRFEWKAVHQANRQRGMADGNEATPVDNDALTNGKVKEKGKGEGKGKGQKEGQHKEQRQTTGRSTRQAECVVFFCKEKGHARKNSPKFTAWLAEKKQTGHEPSANAIEDDGSIFCLGPKPGPSQEPKRHCRC